MMLQPGFEVDRYIVDRLLGEGGMAVVYRVVHRGLGTRHALKVLTITQSKVVQRMLLEGRLQASLQHRNIVSVSDVFEVNGSPALLMEYIPGPALDALLAQHRPTLAEALGLWRGIASGVAHAHASGVIHRDLKPGNVLLALDGDEVVPKVADFGLAKAVGEGSHFKTRTGATFGTPAYMAPEQIRDASRVDERADLFSLGVMLYELVCGKVPFAGDDIIALFTAISKGEYAPPLVVRPDLPRPVVDAIDAMLAPDREDRPARVDVILARLTPEAVGPLLPRAESGETTAHKVSRLTAMVESEPDITASQPTWSAADAFGAGGEERNRSVLQSEPTQLSAWPRWLWVAAALMLAATVLLAVGVGGVGLVAGQLLRSDVPDALAIEAVAESVDPDPVEPMPEVADQPEPPEPEPEVPVRPAVTPPAPVVVPAPAPEPVDVEPEPEPEPEFVTEPESDPAEPEPVGPRPASVSARGDAAVVTLELVGGGATVTLPAEVPAGTWILYVRFEGGTLLRQGELVLGEGQRVVLDCSAAFQQCR